MPRFSYVAETEMMEGNKIFKVGKDPGQMSQNNCGTFLNFIYKICQSNTVYSLLQQPHLANGGNYAMDFLWPDI